MYRFYRYFCLILMLPLFYWGCAEDKTTEPEQTQGDVIILEDSGTQDSVYAILKKAGINVTLGGPYWEYSGQNISHYKVLIFLNGVEWVAVMPDTTQQRIRQFVQNGGKLFSMEWISWSGATNQIINDMLPVTYGGFWNNGSETYYKIVDHPISNGLPNNFTLPGDWSYSATVVDTAAAKQALMVFEGSLSGAAVVTGIFGSGRLMHWNVGGHYNGNNIWSAEAKQILINIVQYLLNP
jgi:trehalose utilization protein